ncbi:MAG: hypothetical protein WCT12_01815 [Verrucomicrobiota bacterium]
MPTQSIFDVDFISVTASLADLIGRECVEARWASSASARTDGFT